MIRSVSDIREPTTARGINEIASAASQRSFPSRRAAQSGTRATVIGPARRRKISCQAGGSISSGLNQVCSSLKMAGTL